MKKRWDRVLYKQIVQQPFQVTTALNLWYLHLVLKLSLLEQPYGHMIKLQVLGSLSTLITTPMSPIFVFMSPCTPPPSANLCHLLAPTVDQACLAWHFVNSCWPHKAFQLFSHKTRRRPHMTSSCLTNYVII